MNSEDRSNDDFRRNRAEEACRTQGNPSHGMKVFGVTGTKGKTTVAFLLEHCLRACGERAALMGTVENRFENWREPALLTTPGADELQALLARFRDGGATAVAMEISSHGLDQFRPWGVRFAGALFTNLTHDHLDYHGTMESYFAAKCRLFLDYDCAVRAIHLQQPWGHRLAQACRKKKLSVITTGAADADVEYGALALTAQGLRGALTWNHKGRAVKIPVESPLLGSFNAQNLAVVVAALLGAGKSPEQLATAISTFPGVPGRMEPITTPGEHPFTVLVDYAHTPDALENALTTLRPLTKESLRVVFGCGGDRDRGKRPVMGAIAERLADEVWITSDNPRTEEPGAIMAEIVSGLKNRPRANVEPDRALAIQNAVAACRPGDLLLIAGKGHEDYQIIGAEKRPFDDRLVAAAALRGLER